MKSAIAGLGWFQLEVGQATDGPP